MGRVEALRGEVEATDEGELDLVGGTTGRYQEPA